MAKTDPRGTARAAVKFRMNISLDKELKTQMDGVEGVNWSAVASKAFEDKVKEITGIRETPTKDEIIERLKKSKKSKLSRYDMGVRAGEYWASHDAEYIYLENLYSYMREFDQEEWSKSTKEPSSLDNMIKSYITELVLRIVETDESKTQDGNENQIENQIKNAVGFWETRMNSQTRRVVDPTVNVFHPDFFRGFLEGARSLLLSVLKEVNDPNWKPDTFDDDIPF